MNTTRNSTPLQPYQRFLDHVPPFQKTMNQDGIRLLLRELNDVHEQLQVIHIAGTNGKGSSAKMLEAIAFENHITTGCFVSPYINDYRECIFINKKMISIPEMNAISQLVEKAYRHLVENKLPLPTHYECITVIAFLAFYRSKSNLCIIETLMGGLYDATNVFSHKLCSLITSISFDHTEYLGNTLELIAYQKAGIITDNSVVFANPNSDDVLQVIQKVAQEKKNEFILSQQYLSEDLAPYYEASSLKGRHQQDNLFGVLSVCQWLNENHHSLRFQRSLILQGLSKIHHLCRIEHLEKGNTTIILDGSHNVDGIIALCNYLKAQFPQNKKNIIFGILKDKDLEKILPQLIDIGNHFYLCEPMNKRALAANELFEYFPNTLSKEIEIITDPLIAFEMALAKKEAEHEILIACGSLYVSCPIRNHFFSDDESY